ncbi:Uncharacterized phage protein gp47/JayE [Lactobacillus bombicola]|uniref:Uncharacterized phage protein gp47/JayE n=1 Tax=Lactobacillus bombicola TaxID=1505723 RepID=A0A1I1TQL3_9LACO|nr:baseplate J/gp47 family protein [Lactobacillus bombicola]SFD60829.1 Uncharacterized phage protein gp47/JayE [Lactobacillus bombicola]
MTTNQYGLTATGFRVPTYDEWVDILENDFQMRFGTDITLTSNSNFGIIIRIMAWRLTEQSQEAQMVYYAAYVSTATDTALDRIGANMSITRKVATPAMGEIQITTEEEYLIQAGEQFETEDGIVFNLINDTVTVKQADNTWQATGIVQADETGSFSNVMAGTVTVVSNPDDNIDTVINPQAMHGGQDDETDEEYRRRIIIESSANPSATVNGIKSALLNVSGVRGVGFVENPKGQTDSYGNPPYSVHIYTLGGAKQDIANTLVKYEGYGPVFVGSESVIAEDMTGDKREYHWDYATEIPIYVHISLSVNANFNSDDDVAAIKEDVINYINSLEMGNTVIVTKMYPSVYSLDGIDEATITIGKNGENLSSSDITTTPLEAPKCSVENVEVIVNGI